MGLVAYWQLHACVCKPTITYIIKESGRCRKESKRGTEKKGARANKIHIHVEEIQTLRGIEIAY